MSTDADLRAHALSFGSVADVYERSRPGYPDDAVRWLTGEEPCDVVDLAAGTGKLTRSLVALGHRVTAIEPVPEMLAHLRTTAPGAIPLAGTAESMPLADESADVVTVAQAFHWFDRPVALREIARVLRPDGRLALVWNARDDGEAWVAEFSDTIVGRSVFRKGGIATATGGIDESGLYGPVAHAEFANEQTLGRAELLELVRSRSTCAILTEEERRPVLERVDGLFDAHAVDGLLTMPYVTECFRAARL